MRTEVGPGPGLVPALNDIIREHDPDTMRATPLTIKQVFDEVMRSTFASAYMGNKYGKVKIEEDRAPQAEAYVVRFFKKGRNVAELKIGNVFF